MDSSDEEFCYVTDEEADLEDLRKLEAALEEDEAGPSRSISQFSFNTKESTCDSLQDDYSNLDTAIALNKLYDQKLQLFELRLQNRLQECQKRLKELQSKVVVSSKPQFNYALCGKPYFKDVNGNVPPENIDTKLRKEAGMYDFSEMENISSWTQQDKNRFQSIMLKMSRELKLKQLQSQLSALCRKQKSNDVDLSDQMDIIKKEICETPTKPLEEVALPIDQEYDWAFIACKSNWKHKPEEYRALWKLFLHPSLNKNKWSKQEHDMLHEIAAQMNFQQWDKIAEQLNTNRSPYQCFVYYRSNAIQSSAGKKWTRQEEEYLKRLIDYYRIENYIPWTKVVACMENRTRVQVYNKYLRLSEERKGRFLPEEDSIILTFADKYGPDFKRMTWYLPGRSLQQCRERYHVLNKKRMSKAWTVDEDRRLIQLVAGKEPERNFSKLTKFFPDKDRINIRSRFLTLERWMILHPNLDIEFAPRRAARQIKRGRKTDNLNKAIVKLKERMESELIKNKKEALTETSPEEEIEDGIVNLLLKEQLKIEENEKYKILPKTKQQKICDNPKYNNLTKLQNTNATNIKCLRQILILLRAKLNKVKFEKSFEGKTYAELLKNERDIFSAVKSYSRKNSAEPKEAAINIPDIWGNQTLGSSMEYVLPPNYSTIIACNILMNYISDSLESTYNLNKCLSHKSALKSEMHLLLSRFYVIFTWPMILSNQGPNENSEAIYDEDYLGRKAFTPVVFKKEHYDFARPIDKDNVIVNDVIDLPQNSQKDETILEIKTLDDGLKDSIKETLKY